MEKLLKEDVKFQWIEIFQEILDTLKNKMVTTPILVFLDWKKEFYVHVDASSVTLGVVLEQPGEGLIDHLISFTRKEELYHDRKRRTSYGIRSA